MAVIDTLKTAKSLQEAGFSQPQAEAISVAVNDAQREAGVTKGDLFAMKGELRQDFQGLELKVERLNSDVNLLKWISGLNTALLFGLVVKLIVL